MSEYSKTISEIVLEQTEKQLWEIVKYIPGINVTYGTVRCIVYVVKKDEKEATDSAIVAAKGAIQTAAITAGVITAPVTIPLAAGVLTGIVAKSVTESTEVIVFFVTNAEQFRGTSNDHRERILYDKIKSITGIGALYSAIRVPVYIFKKDKKQSIESGVNLIENSGNVAIQLGINMIPNIDEQLQKLILKTSRHAIRFLSKKVLEQVSQQTIQLEHGVNAVSKVENDCDAILEMTNVVSDMANEMESSSQIDNEAKKMEDDQASKSKNGKSFMSCCFCRRKHKSRLPPQTDNKSNINTLSLDKFNQTSHPDKGHLMILTD